MDKAQLILEAKPSQAEEIKMVSPASELRCTSCHKLLMKDGEIKCPRCKDLVAVSRDCLILPQENVYLINTADLLGRQLQELLAKWPAALQQEFVYALQLVKGTTTGQNNTTEVIREKIKIKLVERPAAADEKIVPDKTASKNVGTSLKNLSEALIRIGIEPDLDYLQIDPQYRRLAFDLILLLSGRAKPTGELIPLANIYGFLVEPAKTSLVEQGLKAANPREAYLMAYWEKNMGHFQYKLQGKKVWEFDSRNEKRDAIICLTKNKLPSLTKKILN